MIFFEESIFHPKDYKIDHIKLEDNRIIHYKISSDLQNQRWFIAITLEESGQIIPQIQLSKRFNSYGLITAYIKTIPTILDSNQKESTLSNEMKLDFDNLILATEILIKRLSAFKEKYNV